MDSVQGAVFSVNSSHALRLTYTTGDYDKMVLLALLGFVGSVDGFKLGAPTRFHNVRAATTVMEMRTSVIGGNW